MKVRYSIVKKITVNKDIEYDIEYSTGEIAGFIPGNKNNPDMFLIADDKSGAFIKVKVFDCIKIEDNANS